MNAGTPSTVAPGSVTVSTPASHPARVCTRVRFSTVRSTRSRAWSTRQNSRSPTGPSRVRSTNGLPRWRAPFSEVNPIRETCMHRGCQGIVSSLRGPSPTAAF